MKEVKNGERGNELEGQGELEGETKPDDNSNQPKNKQQGIFILLQVRKRNLLRCYVLRNYSLKLSVVTSSYNSNHIY